MAVVRLSRSWPRKPVQIPIESRKTNAWLELFSGDSLLKVFPYCADELFGLLEPVT